ncbi:MAG: hypothetical protein ACTHNW_00090 [Mucilaginibacter sp.]
MREFYIHVELRQGPTWVQVDEVPPESWSKPGVPAFIIEYDSTNGNVLLTVQLEQGIWYDQNTHSSEENVYFQELEEDSYEHRYPDYQSPLYSDELRAIGDAISRHMVVALSAYLGLFYNQFRRPALN